MIKILFSIIFLIAITANILGWITYHTIAKPKAEEITHDITSYLYANELYVNEKWFHQYIMSLKQSGKIKDHENISINYRQPSNDRRFTVDVRLSGNYLNGYASPRTVHVSMYGINYGALPESTISIWYNPRDYNSEKETINNQTEKEVTNNDEFNDTDDSQSNFINPEKDIELDQDIAGEVDLSGTDFYFTAEEERLFKQVDRSCIGCHGGNWEGAAGPSFFNLSQKYSKEEILDIIMNGTEIMPGGLLSEEDSKALADYLYHLPDPYDYSNEP